MQINITSLLTNSVSTLKINNAEITIPKEIFSSSLIDELKNKIWICNYTKAKKQKIVSKAIMLIGIENTIKLLNIRRRIKLWIQKLV